MRIVTTIETDFGQHKPHPCMYAKQGDKDSRLIRVVLTDNGRVFAPEAGTTATLHLYGAGSTIRMQGLIQEDGAILSEIPARAMASPGTLQGDLILEKGGVETILAGFSLVVEAMPISGGVNPSDDDYSFFAELFAAAVRSGQNAQIADAAAKEAAKYAADAADSAASGGSDNPMVALTAEEYDLIEKDEDTFYLVYLEEPEASEQS